MKNLIRNFGLTILALSLLVVVGCGKGVTREANVSEGDYYSAEEFKKLDGDQRDAYCAELDGELARLEQGKVDNGQQSEASSAELAAAQNEVRSLESSYNAKKSETDGLEEEIEYYENLPKVHVVEDGEFLQKISGYERIYADAAKWPRIYFANKDRIEDPNMIFPGWELNIPRN